MSKILVVRKPDQTIHQIPLENKAALMAFNNRLPVGLRWKLEEMDEKDAAKLPYYDKDYVTAENASKKIEAKDKELAAKDAKLKELEDKLAALTAAQESTKSAAKESAKESAKDAAKHK